MKVVIVANGTAPSFKLLSQEVGAAVIICADGGANVLYKYRIMPDYIIGDLDSIAPEALAFYQPQVIIERHPQEKAATDTELALHKALSLKATEIVGLGLLGGRVDHVIGNLGILGSCLKAGVKARFQDDEQTLTMLNHTTRITGEPGKHFSLLAYDGVVTKLSITGAKYVLHDYDLLEGDVRTISNEFVGQPVNISFDLGKLLLISE